MRAAPLLISVLATSALGACANEEDREGTLEAAQFGQRRDTGVDTSVDTGPDVRADVSVDAPDVSDAGTDATTDAGTSALPSFPGAEGFGAGATGGRGGRVIYVTNLATEGPGSLNDALAQTGPRYVLFRVSGVINGEAHVGAGDVTLAGQTSPGGVIVRGIDTTEDPYCDQSCGSNARGVQNIILRHLRTRPAGGSFPDGMRIRYARNVVVDHVSIGNAADEAVEISYSNNVTIQNTLLAETVGTHASLGGMLINYSNPAAGYALDRLSIHHNVWNRLQGRYPELSRESGTAAAGTTMQIELSNNVLWDQQYFIDVNCTNISGVMSGAPVYYQLNWVGNQGFARTSNPYGMIYFPTNSVNNSTTYFNDNALNLYPTRRDYDLDYCCNDFPEAGGATIPPYGRGTRHAFPAITYTSGADLRAYAVANVGAFPRDPMDRRLMDPVRTNVITATRSDVNPVNDPLALDFSASAPPAPPPDADLDGMPDAWESAHGLNPYAQDHNGTSLSLSMTGVGGYTNLECYLNELSDQRVGAVGCAPGSCCACGAGTTCCPAGGSAVACVQLSSDLANCGACGRACAAGQTCTAGACVTPSSCASPRVMCGTSCVDTQTDAGHCGACGAACAAGLSCAAGRCVCPAGQTLCGGACVATATDARNCGACGRACATGQTCSAGVCACAAPSTVCSGVCANTQTDPRNCGRCGTVCGLGAVCAAGRCACPAGSVLDGGVCVSLASDPSHCGTSSTRCNDNQMCSGGRCVCRAGLTLVSANTCVNLQSSPTNCGAIGTRCSGATPVCVAGTCQPVSACTAPNNNCSGACVDRRSDSLNCGSCGRLCHEDQVCVSGSCRAFIAPVECNSCPCACPSNAVCCASQDRTSGVCLSNPTCS